MTRQSKVVLPVLSLLLAACATHQSPDDPNTCTGKCDGAESYDSPWVADLDALNAMWHGEPVTKIEQAFSVKVSLGNGIAFDAPTHHFGTKVNVIPYSNEDDAVDARGNAFARGDAVIAKLFPPGAVGYAVKHHRPEYRALDMQAAGGHMKEHFKLQDTHIENVIGVTRDGQAGAITLNNPQGYEDGLFGTPNYPMIFVRPVFPAYVTDDTADAFEANIRTMLLGFNAVSDFPGSYNGGDPLAAHSPERIRQHVAMMVKAIAGDQAAHDWFFEPANLIYCAELAHVGSSAGILVPLNESIMVPMVGQEAWDAFVAEVDKHNAGEPSAFTTMNDNGRAALVTASLSPEWLLPLPEYAPADIIEEERQKLAFQPMTAAHIVGEFLRTHLPRELIGESMAPAQGMVLQQMKPALFEAMSLDQLPETDPRWIAADQLFNRVVAVVAQPYADYAAFREALAPVMDDAHKLTGPRDDTGTGYFVPPSLLHVVAQGKHTGGLLRLQYLGHGLHISMVYETSAPVPPPDPDPEAPVVPTPDDPYGASCRISCGGASPNGTCFCDSGCRDRGDCCEDVEEHCPCCRTCTVGKACGNSCISRSYQCTRPSGCACNAYTP